MKASTVKTADLPKTLIADIFKAINGNKVEIKTEANGELIIVTMTEPNKLLFPEGWYYEKGALRNEQTSTKGSVDEIPMRRRDGASWAMIARYSTRC